MSHGSWSKIKKAKGFYITTYRKAGTFLAVSMCFNLLLILSICYIQTNKSAPAFYATSGILPPVKLITRDSANFSPYFLLPPDVVSNEVKVIPQ